MSPHVMMMEKCTRWETSGRRNIWVPSVPVLAMVDSRCVSVCPYACAGSVGICTFTARCVFRCVTVIFLFPNRAGAARTVKGLDRRTSTLTSSILYRQMPSIDTEKMPCVNWSVNVTFKPPVRAVWVLLPTILSSPHIFSHGLSRTSSVQSSVCGRSC